MTAAEPPRNPGFMPENRDRILLAEQALFRATAMVVAPLRMLQPPLEMEAEATTSAPPGASRAKDDLDEIMAKLKAAAARAEEVPLSRVGNRHLVIAAAIALSMISGAVTAQYLVPGHARPSIALSPGK